MDDEIGVVLEHWLVEWCTTSDLAAGSSKFTAQCKKEQAKLKKAQLAKKRKKEVSDKVQAEHDVSQQTEKQTGEIEHGYDKGTSFPLPKTEEETDEKIEQNCTDTEMTSNCIKNPREQEKLWSRKKSKASKASLNPITLTEGDLHEIGDTVRDVTVEALQQFKQ